MPYIYRVSRREPAREQADVTVEKSEPEVSYRDLQAKAKDLDIPANQSRDDLEAAIAEAQRE